MAGTSLGGASFGDARASSGAGTPLPFAAAGALVAAVAIALLLLADRTTVRRDVS